MSFYYTSVPDLEQGVIRPMVLQALKEMVGAYFMETNTVIDYVDYTGAVQTIGNGIGREGSEEIKLDSANRVTAKAVTRPLTDQAMVAPRNIAGNPPVWRSERLESFIQVSRQRSKTEIEITYNTNSRSEALNWANQFVSRMGMGLGTVLFNASYQATIPDTLLVILKGVFETGKKVHPELANVNFVDWLKEHFTRPYDIISNATGSHKHLVLREQLQQIVGILPEEVPDPVSANNGYEITLTLEFQWDVPAMVQLTYPIFVAGVEISKGLFDHTLDRNAVNRTEFAGNIAAYRNLMKWNDDQAKVLYRERAYIYPQYDPVDVDYKKYLVTPVVQARVSVDPNNPRDLLDLGVLEAALGVQFHQSLMLYIQNSGDLVFHPNKAGVTVFVCRDGVPLTPDHYTLDGLTIKADYDMDPKANYHVFLALTDDIYGITESHVDEFLRHGDLVNSIIRYNYPWIPLHRYPIINEDGSVSKHDLVAMEDVIKDRNVWPKNRMFTATTIIVDTKFK